MWTDLGPAPLKWLGTVLMAAGTAGAPVTACAETWCARTKLALPAAPGPFSDVPVKHPAYIAADAGPGPDFGEPNGALPQTFADARKPGRHLLLVEALEREFAPELKLLNVQREELGAEVSGWRVRSGSLVEGLRKATPADRPQSTGR